MRCGCTPSRRASGICRSSLRTRARRHPRTRDGSCASRPTAVSPPVVDGLDRPTSMEFVGRTALVSHPHGQGDEDRDGMSVRPIREPDWLFVPPLELPLALRMENGRFGAPRPRGPALQIHEAVDLAAESRQPGVRRPQPGASPRSRPTPRRRGATHDRSPPAWAGFVSKYLHITIAVGPGDFVQKGAPSRGSRRPAGAHLHFELWLTIDPPTASGPAWPNDETLCRSTRRDRSTPGRSGHSPTPSPPAAR